MLRWLHMWRLLCYCLLFVRTSEGLGIYSTRRFVLYLTLCHLFLCFSVLLALRLPHLGKRELILALFVRLFDLCLFGCVDFLFLLVSGKGPGVGLTLCCFVVYSTRRFVVCLSVCLFVLVFFSPFSIAITSLGEERANLSAFRTFVRFVLVWICRFPGRAAVCDCGTPWTFLLSFFCGL